MNQRLNSGLRAVLAGALAIECGGGCRSFDISPGSLALRGANSLMTNLAMQMYKDTMENSPPYRGNVELLLRVTKEVPNNQTSFVLAYDPEISGETFSVTVTGSSPRGFRETKSVYADTNRDYVFASFGNVHGNVSANWAYEDGTKFSNVEFKNMGSPQLLFGLNCPNIIITHLERDRTALEFNGVLMPAGFGYEHHKKKD